MERRLRRGCQDGPAALEVRSRSASQVRPARVLRCRQPRRGVLQGPGVCRRARWPADRHRCEERQAGLVGDHRRSEAGVHQHRGAPHRQGQGDHRQRRRRVRRARIRVRVRRRDRQAGMALLHRAGRSVEAAGEQGPRQGAAHVEGRQLVEARRWRHRVGFDRLRP